jgi:hypothetical protein
MKAAVRRGLGIFITIMTAIFMAVLPANTRTAFAANYDTVDLTEDTYNTLIKGTTKYNGVDYSKAPYYYNPLYYFLNYADLRAAFGADPAKLVEHYALYGIKEKRVANQEITRGAHSWGSSNEYIVPSYQLTSNQQNGMVVIPEQLHNNGGMNRRQDTEARNVAKQLAQSIYATVMLANNPVNNNNNNNNTNNNTNNTPVISEIQMLAYATGIVNAYCKAGTELTRVQVEQTNSKVYRTAYGVFCAHEFTSAGATRALGLIVDYLDEIIHQNFPDAAPLKWVHVGANTWGLQYCQLACDNHEAYADALNGIAGYGKHPLQGGVEQDIQQYVNYATLSQIINSRPPFTDIGQKSSEDLPKNTNPMSGIANDYNWP